MSKLEKFLWHTVGFLIPFTVIAVLFAIVFLLRPELRFGPWSSPPSAAAVEGGVSEGASVPIIPDSSCSSEISDPELPLAPLVACAAARVNEWLNQVYPDIGVPNYYMVPPGTKGSEAGCDFQEDAGLYCLGNHGIYIGEVRLEWSLSWGEGIVELYLAHEATHFVQHQRGIMVFFAPGSSIPIEDQADCGVGAFLRWMDAHIGLPEGIEDNVVAFFGTIGEASDKEDRTHGTNRERQRAFLTAWESTLAQPLEACNDYVPFQRLFG